MESIIDIEKPLPLPVDAWVWVVRSTIFWFCRNSHHYAAYGREAPFLVLAQRNTQRII